MLKRCVMVSATSSLSGTLRSVMTTAQSSPRMPMVVVVPVLMALKAYSGRREGGGGGSGRELLRPITALLKEADGGASTWVALALGWH